MDHKPSREQDGQLRLEHIPQQDGHTPSREQDGQLRLEHIPQQELRVAGPLLRQRALALALVPAGMQLWPKGGAVSWLQIRETTRYYIHLLRMHSKPSTQRTDAKAAACGLVHACLSVAHHQLSIHSGAVRAKRETKKTRSSVLE
jgi:hypothetical protein